MKNQWDIVMSKISIVSNCEFYVPKMQPKNKPEINLDIQDLISIDIIEIHPTVSSCITELCQRLHQTGVCLHLRKILEKYK